LGWFQEGTLKEPVHHQVSKSPDPEEKEKVIPLRRTYRLIWGGVHELHSDIEVDVLATALM
jgi:hypothetical protein